MDIAETLEPLIPALRRYARALLRDRWDADDLVQDCLERAIGRWHQCRDAGNPRAWLFAILHNLAMTRLRSATRRPRTVPVEDAAPVPIRASQEDELHYQDIVATLAQLPAEQRTLLLLISVEDLSYAEAAKILEIPIGTVMSRLSRARDRLHQLLSAELGGDHTRSPLRIVK